MKNFLRLKQDTEVGIDGMLVNETKKFKFDIKKILIIQSASFFNTRLNYFYLSKRYST